MQNASLLRRSIESAMSQGASYAEARYGQKQRETNAFASGQLTQAGSQLSDGWSLRVLVDGYWGFAASARVEGSEVPHVVEAALGFARAAQRAGGPRAELAPAPSVVAEHVATGTVNPFTVPMSTRLDMMAEVHRAMVDVNGVVGSRGMLDFHLDVMELMTSEGTEVNQHLGVIGGGYVALAEGPNGSATRSFPHHGGKDYATAGYEWVDHMGFVANAERTAREAAALLDAGPCPTGRTTVVLDSAMVGTLLHETVGHATELDRIIGDERDNFGGSFVSLDDIGTFPYASPAVSINADATYPLAAGSYGYDAEGVAAQSLPIIDRGVLVGAMNSRESAAQVGAIPAGTGRAVDWTRIPMARMTNMVLQPGQGSTQDLIAGIDDGVYIAGDATTDIDDNRELCSFGGEIGWRIRGGELAEVVSKPILYTDSHQILRQVDRVAGPEESWVTGILGCGKGQPWQFVFSGQGGPPVRARNVEIGFPEGAK